MTDIRDWGSFVASSRSFFDANRESPMFGLIQRLDELYRVAHAKAPFPRTGVEVEDLVQKCFVLSHWSMLSAATNTASGLPEDGPAITRRALEAAKVCLAVKAHPDNFNEWQAAEQRAARWSVRAMSKKPKGPPVSPRYKKVSENPVYQELQALIGVLSDAAVHFTPEHFDGYIWKQSHNVGGTMDTSVGMGENVVAYRLFQLVDQHLFIVSIFDNCLGGKLLVEPDVMLAWRKVVDLLKKLLVLEGLPDQARLVERRWSFTPPVSG